VNDVFFLVQVELVVGEFQFDIVDHLALDQLEFDGLRDDVIELECQHQVSDQFVSQ